MTILAVPPPGGVAARRLRAHGCPKFCLGKVGARLRTPRSRASPATAGTGNKLIEMCRVVDTVLVDQETIYAPRHGNDRCLLA